MRFFVQPKRAVPRSKTFSQNHAFLLIFSGASVVRACSSVHVPSPTGDDTIIGRTMELGGSGGERFFRSSRKAPSDGIPWMVAIHRRGETIGRGVSHPCGPAAEGWEVKFGYVSVDVNMSDAVVATDGINELGITVSEHTLRQSEYMAPIGKLSKQSSQHQICWMAFTSWVLGNVDSVANLRALLPSLRILGPTEPVPSGDLLHWSIDDVHGEHVVLEVLEGQILVHNNTVGAFTNDPDFRWHLRNLNNYVNLSPNWPSGGTGIKVQTEIGALPDVVGHGFNLGGLPGDASPPARFVRLFYQRSYAMLKHPPTSLNGSIALVSALLNSVMISHGTLADIPGSTEEPEFTQYTVMKLPRARHFYFKDYMNTRWRLVRLDELDFSPARNTAAPTQGFPLVDGTLGVEDVTGRFEQK